MNWRRIVLLCLLVPAALVAYMVFSAVGAIVLFLGHESIPVIPGVTYSRELWVSEEIGPIN